MRRIFWKAAAGVLAVTFAAGSLAACSQGRGLDPTISHLYVGNYGAGLRSEWLNAFISDFEAKYADVSFEEGKKGVKVHPSEDRAFGGTSLYTTIANKQADVIFGEDIAYYDYHDGRVLDMTDVVTGTWTWEVKDGAGAPLTLRSTYDDAGDLTTIAAKMGDSQRDYYLSGQKYFGLPYYTGNVNITYNEDVFAECNAYFLEGKSAADFNESAPNYSSIFGSIEDELSLGADGMPSTLDDGLPATYDDFFLLCRYLREQGSVNGTPVMPLVMCGSYDGYLLDYAETLLADSEGAEQFMLNLTGQGVAKTLGRVDGSGNFVSDGTETTIDDAQDMKQLQRQRGRYDALTFAHEFGTTGGNFPSNSMSGLSQTYAQRYFIDGTSDFKYAMLLDGNWWECEATESFRRHGEDAKLDYAFKPLPVPKATAGQIKNERTFVTTQSNAVFINGNIANNEVRKNLAKLFVYEFHTNDALVQYNSVTGVTRPYEYEMDKQSDTWKGMSIYAQSLYELYVEDEFTTVVFGETKLTNGGATQYLLDNWSFQSKVKEGNDTKTYANPIKVFYQNPSLSVSAYFSGLEAYHA